jgi:hypothetical protein
MAPHDFANLAGVTEYFDVSALIPMAVFFLWWVLGD